MGIRIHKVMGYGLDDVKTTDGSLTDSRFNEFDYNDVYEKFDEFKNWLINNKSQPGLALELLTSKISFDPRGFDSGDIGFIKLGLERIDKLPSYRVSNPLTMDFEYGMDNVVLLTPVEELVSWYRHDDIIDYEEHSVYNKDGIDNKCINLFKETSSCGIYPYTSMQLIPGRSVSGDPMLEAFSQRSKNFLAPSDYNQLTGRWDKNQKPLAAGALLKHLQEDWAPSIPTSVKLYALYMDLFKDPYTIYDLRPMIYTYWS